MEARMSPVEVYRESEERMRACRFQRLIRSLRLFIGNYRELKGVLDHHNSDAGFREMFGLRNAYKAEDILNEVTRVVQNYLLSAMSLRDHCRRLEKTMMSEGKDLTSYRREVQARFIGDQQVQFFESLRNYVTHYGNLPFITSQDVIKGIQGIALDVEVILASPKIAKGKTFAVDHRIDGLDLSDCVDYYQEVAVGFYLWFESEYTRLYQSDFDVTEKLTHDISDYLSPRRQSEVMYGFNRLKEGYSLSDVERSLATAFTLDQWREYYSLPPNPSVRGAAAVQMLQALRIDDRNFLAIVGEVYRKAVP